jgi:hypothetical protein
MNKQKLNVWGREFELEIVFDCYEGEEVLNSQKETLQRFLEIPALIAESESKVKRYCLAQNAEDIGSQPIENIFKYVIPKSLYIQRSTDNERVIGLICAYKFDVDNGIAVVFKNEKLERVGTQNIIL